MLFPALMNRLSFYLYSYMFSHLKGHHPIFYHYNQDRDEIDKDFLLYLEEDVLYEFFIPLKKLNNLHVIN